MTTQRAPHNGITSDDMFNYVDRIISNEGCAISPSKKDLLIYNHGLTCPVCYSASKSYFRFSRDLQFINEPDIIH